MLFEAGSYVTQSSGAPINAWRQFGIDARQQLLIRHKTCPVRVRIASISGGSNARILDQAARSIAWARRCPYRKTQKPLPKPTIATLPAFGSNCAPDRSSVGGSCVLDVHRNNPHERSKQRARAGAKNQLGDRYRGVDDMKVLVLNTA